MKDNFRTYRICLPRVTKISRRLCHPGIQRLKVIWGPAKSIQLIPRNISNIFAISLHLSQKITDMLSHLCLLEKTMSAKKFRRLFLPIFILQLSSSIPITAIMTLQILFIEKCFQNLGNIIFLRGHGPQTFRIFAFYPH